MLSGHTPQGSSPPVFLAFLRWTNLSPTPRSSDLWAWLCPRPIFGTRRRLAKSRAIPSPADEVGQPRPARLSPTRLCGLLPLGDLRPPAFGRLFFGAAVHADYLWRTGPPRKVSRHS